MAYVNPHNSPQLRACMGLMAVVLGLGNFCEYLESKYLKEARKMTEDYDEETLKRVFFGHWYKNARLGLECCKRPL